MTLPIVAAFLRLSGFYIYSLHIKDLADECNYFHISVMSAVHNYHNNNLHIFFFISKDNRKTLRAYFSFSHKCVNVLIKYFILFRVDPLD